MLCRSGAQKALIVFLIVFTMNAAGAQRDSRTPYSFGVFPYLSPIKMDAIFAPVSQQLAELLNRRVRFRTASTMPLFVERLRTGHYDFAILQPVLYPLVRSGLDYVPIAKFEETLTAQILVPANSPVRSVRDLQGKVMATPPLLGAIFHLAAREIEQAGLVLGQDIKLRKNNRIDACVQQIMIDQADACLAPSFSVPQIQQSLGRELRVLLQSGSVPNRLLIVRKDMPKHEQASVLQAFLGLGDVPEGPRLLQAMGTRGFAAFESEDYEKMRKLPWQDQQGQNPP